MEEIKSALAGYILVLRDSLARCHRAEDRVKYERHLAAAAVMLAEMQKGSPVAEILKMLEQEKRGYGWDYLSDAEGEKAEAAFAQIVKLLENKAGNG